MTKQELIDMYENELELTRSRKNRAYQDNNDINLEYKNTLSLKINWIIELIGQLKELKH